MANRKISDLTALTAPATGDLLPIVDISEAAAADKNKKITIGELFASIPAGTAAAPSVAFEGDSNTGIYSPGADQVAISTNGDERLRIDSSGSLLVGTSSARSNFFNSTNSARLQIEGSGSNDNYALSIVSNFAGGTSGAQVILAKSGGSNVGDNTLVTDGNTIGQVTFQGADGTDFVEAARISAVVDGTPGANDMPGCLVFSTTADGAPSPTERMRIQSDGRILLNTISPAAVGGLAPRNVFSHSSGSQWAASVQHTVAAGSPFGLAISYTASTPNNTSSDFLWCDDATAIRARIYSNGGLANYQANNVNLSDINTKKDISPAADTWNCLKEWEIVSYRYKDQPDDADLSLGVIAQQVAESCPEVITIFQEAKEATETEPAKEERLGVKEQQMYWMAIKALQEAQARIEALEADVAQLKGA